MTKQARLNPIGLEAAQAIAENGGSMEDSIRAYLHAEFRAVGFTIDAYEMPRNDRAIAMLAAWMNVQPSQLPPAMRYHPNESTMQAWDRVAQAARKFEEVE